LGVQYQTISRQAALANEVPQGAYVLDVVKGSPAEKAGIKVDDIITKISGEKVGDEAAGLAGIINKHKVGETIQIEVWRDGKTLILSATLTEAKQ
jgi:serine protease Do